MHNVTFPVLSCNINASNDPFIDGLFAPSVVLHVDGERVAVVGYTTDETRFLVEQGGCTRVFQINFALAWFPSSYSS